MTSQTVLGDPRRRERICATKRGSLPPPKMAAIQNAAHLHSLCNSKLHIMHRPDQPNSASAFTYNFPLTNLVRAASFVVVPFFLWRETTRANDAALKHRTPVPTGTLHPALLGLAHLAWRGPGVKCSYMSAGDWRIDVGTIRGARLSVPGLAPGPAYLPGPCAHVLRSMPRGPWHGLVACDPSLMSQIPTSRTIPERNVSEAF